MYWDEKNLLDGYLEEIEDREEEGEEDDDHER